MNVKLTWTDRNTNETGHRIYRSSSPMDTADLPPPVVELGPNVTEWEDTDTPVDQVVYYIVSAVRGTEEAFSGEVAIDTGATYDPHWDNVVALLHFDGDLINDKTEALPWKYVGETDFDQGLFAAALDCSTNDAALVIQTAPFAFDMHLNMTLEGFFKSSGINRQTLFQLENWHDAIGGAVSVFTQNNTFVVRCALNTSGNPFTDITTPFVLPADWLHIAVCFEAGRVRVYTDGEIFIDSSLDSSKFFTDVSRVAVCGDHGEPGGSFIDGRYFKGLVDEVRITKGVARYTEDFTPPTAPFPNQ